LHPDLHLVTDGVGQGHLGDFAEETAQSWKVGILVKILVP
jgi:hypothetical protein